MKSLSILIVVFIILILTACGRLMMNRTTPDIRPIAEEFRPLSQEERITQDTQRRGVHYGSLMERFISELDHAEPGGTVFLGDSITEGFPVNKVFEGKNFYNRGIGGDRVQGLRERLDICVDALQPAKIYIMIGTNDAIYPLHESIDDWAKDYQNLVHEIKFYAPQADIALFSILPLGPRFEQAHQSLYEYNSHVKNIARENQLDFIDLDTIMKNEQGYLKQSYTGDDVHLTLEGYVAWLMVLLGSEDSFQAVWNIAPDIKARVNRIGQLSAVNPAEPFVYPGGRGPDQLIVYTPEYHNTSTRTNEWGQEVLVRKGKVIEFPGNDTLIPEDGFIISGHGIAAQWMTHNLHPGRTVTLEGMKIIVEEQQMSDMLPDEQLRYLKNMVICSMADMQESGKTPDNAGQLEEIWKDIVRLYLSPQSITSKETENIYNKFKRIW